MTVLRLGEAQLAELRHIRAHSGDDDDSHEAPEFYCKGCHAMHTRCRCAEIVHELLPTILDTLDAAHAEAEKLRGIRPTIRHGDGSKGTRFGIRWNGPQSPLAVPMDDGYWTPWHVAQAELAAVKRQRDELIRLKTGRNPDELVCCNGIECGCMGATVREEELHYIDRALAAEQPKPADITLPAYGIDHTGKVVKLVEAEQPKPPEGGA